MGVRYISGFSYVEVIAVTAIASLLISISVPSFVKVNSTGLLKHEAKKLQLVLEDSLTRAQTQNQEIEFIGNVSSYQVIDSNGNKVISGYFKTGITLKPKNIKFYPSGVQSATTLFLKYQNKNCKLILSLRGRVKIVC